MNTVPAVASSRQTPLMSDLVKGHPPLIPVLRIEDADHSEPLLDALERGGIGIVEVTLRTPAAFEVIRRMRKASRNVNRRAKLTP